MPIPPPEERSIPTRFKPGVSGNPNGRPRKKTNHAVPFAKAIRSRTRDGLALLEFALGVMDGTETNSVMSDAGDVVDLPASLRDRLDACKWLAERGFGKAPITALELGADENQADDSTLSDEALEAQLLIDNEKGAH